MNKKTLLILTAVAIAIVLGFLFFSGGDNTTSTRTKTDPTDNLLTLTYDYSKEYVDLRIRTDNALLNAKDFGSYKAWNDEMTTLGYLWKQMADHADFLKQKADEYSQITSAPGIISFLQIPQAYAYSKSMITNIFDNAPAGQGIKKLASYLGVDARRAFEILKGDQEQVKADAYIKEGNTMRKLENSAVVLKDGCKVAGFVGGVVLSGGTAGFAASGVVAQGTVVVTGSDMVLEVADDGANIAMGDKNKVSAIIGKARVFTEPAASILSLNDVAKNLAANAPNAAEKIINKANAVMFNADQIRSIVQDKKVLGISFADSKKNEKAQQAFATLLKKNEVKQWIKENSTKKRTVADSLDDLSDEIQDRTVLDSLDDLENELDYKEFVKEYVAKQNKELEADRQQINDKADARIKSAEKELKQQTQESAIEDTKKTDSSTGTAEEAALFGKNGETSLKITSPEGTALQEGQVQTWKTNVPKPAYNSNYAYECTWHLYQNGAQVWEELHGCGFVASTNIKPGPLQVKVTLHKVSYHYEEIPGNYAPGEETKTKRVADILDTAVAERNYEVNPIPADTYQYGQ